MIELGEKVDGTNTYVDITSTTILYMNPFNGELDVFHGEIETEECCWGSLEQLQKQINSNFMKVIYEMGLSGKIFTYNNHGDKSWYLTGKTMGYA